jgi:hypothetical protein
MDLSRVGFVFPDRFCRCTNMRHACNKHISNFDEKFGAWLDGRGF